MKIPRSADYEENRKQHNDPDGVRSCVVCGRPVEGGKVRFMVECVNGLDECVMPGLTDPSHQSYVGCYPLDEACLADHPELKPYVLKIGTGAARSRTARRASRPKKTS